jgi:hypothetical protein
MGVVDLLATYGTRVVGIALLAGAGAAISAFLYRVTTRELLGRGVSLLAGLSVAALYLNVRNALGQVVAGETTVLASGAVTFNSVSLAAAALATPAGHVVGDRVARDFASVRGAEQVDGGVGRLARLVSRVTTVTVPETVGDIEGFDPVPAATKADVAGATLVFPGRLDAAETRERLAARLRADHEVGYVDAEFDDGDLVSLALGARQAGLGPTLPPGVAAVAVRADPPNAASAGDVVQVYDVEDEPTRVATAEVRATVGDVVTLACDVQEARGLAGGDFASLLRAADETMAALAVGAESDLVGTTVGAVAATVVAVRDAGGDVVPIPPRSRPVAGGETLYVVARPETIRELEALAA